MRVLALVNAQSTQKALCTKFAEAFELVGVVISENKPRKKAKAPKFRWLLNGVAGRTFGAPLTGAWHALVDRYAASYPDFPGSAQKFHVSNVNDDETIVACESLMPDIVIVSGTNLLSAKTITALHERSRFGVLNLHTGISPYVKGGPNCTNWCLAKGWFHLIGSTVMWIDAGVDSGDIIATERTALSGEETLKELHWKVMEHAHDLYLRSVQKLRTYADQLPRIPQSSVGPHHTFKNSEFSFFQIVAAESNFYRRYSKQTFESEDFQQLADRFPVFPI
jgi:methionyl-tRNA formyltransferase